MIPHLTSTCGCGRSVSIPCPTLADLPAAQAQMIGWGFDERGMVRCPQCLAGEPVPVVPKGRGDLFEGAA